VAPELGQSSKPCAGYREKKKKIEKVEQGNKMGEGGKKREIRRMGNVSEPYGSRTRRPL